ncbi:MAG TPA: aspartate--tRNA ligase [Candidatus Nanoarchaeia archaeon]
MKRTYTQDLADQAGREVTVFGWVNSRRDHGKIIFFDLRDSTGLLQVVSTPKQGSYNAASKLTSEDVVKVVGTVQARPKENTNKELKTGKIELVAKEIEIIGKAKELPIPINTNGDEIDEMLRLRYRYLDLRRERLQRNLKVRHKVVSEIREVLDRENFIEVETPYLSKTTPEGARDFLVPSRLQKGKFYALAQSPQQYKQLLMIAGIERYYQLPRAFRDEDLRADRQLEHTQVDIEIAFVEREDVLSLVERLMIGLIKKLGKRISTKPFPRYTHKQALEKFGADKFDFRDDKNDPDELAFAFVTDFPLFEYDKEEKRWTFSHNPFTSPDEKGLKDVMEEKRIGEIGSLQYDLVCNGFELASGSIRIHDPAVQKQVFKIMGYSESEIKEDFGHILEAYEYGAPVHGGIAVGLDRLVAVVAGESSIREVIAFPVTSSGQTSVMEAPSVVEEKKLKELGIEVKKINKE